MKRVLSIVAVLLTLSSGTIAEKPDGWELTKADRIAIEQVIRAQLAAFTADDGATAFSYASPGIRRKFGTPEAFTLMVRRQYEAIYRPLSISFGTLAVGHDGPVQHVGIVAPNAQAITALYLMERQADGTWTIGGCFFVPSDDKVA